MGWLGRYRRLGLWRMDAEGWALGALLLAKTLKDNIKRDDRSHVVHSLLPL
tara:strand:- start:393 stop:545 length:153 start_codon:yes stop_codon:yes gene_type:complete